MPRAFTVVEKDTIRDKLMEAGRTCFLRYGMKKTTLDDLVRPAGIAKASFYLFFETKESLYLEIFISEIPAMMDRLMGGSFERTDDTREALVLLMKGILNEMETNEFARIILDDPAEIERLLTSIDFTQILEQLVNTYSPITKRIVAAQARGEIIPGDPNLLGYTLGLVKMLAINRDRLPPELYNAMVDLAPQIIADGLTCPASKNKARSRTQSVSTDKKKEVS